MTEKRFTNIEHDYENAWIKCNDDGDFMIYAIYKELDESLPSLEDLLNGLHEENQILQSRNKRLEEKIQRERNATTKQHLKWSDEAETKIKELEEENEQLRKENKELEKFRYAVFQRMEELQE